MDRNELLMAMEAARTLAERGLVHPIADAVGDEDVLDWVALFREREGGRWSGPDRAKQLALLREQLRIKAACQGWVLREQRDHPRAGERTHAIERVKSIQGYARELPAHLRTHLPISPSDLALQREVQRELAAGLVRSLAKGVDLARAGVQLVPRPHGAAAVLIEGVEVGEVHPTRGSSQRQQVEAMVEQILGRPAIDQLMQTLGEDAADSATPPRSSARSLQGL